MGSLAGEALVFRQPVGVAAGRGSVLEDGPRGLRAGDRAVLFDSRIPHYGRAPSRAFAGLRVTIAFKLEAAA